MATIHTNSIREELLRIKEEFSAQTKAGIESSGCERRTRIDIVFEKTIEHFDAEIKQCPECHEITKAEFPQDIHGKLQYGNGLKAFIIHLIISQMVAVNRVKKMIVAMIGKKLSEATILSFVLRLHLALEVWEQIVTPQTWQ